MRFVKTFVLRLFVDSNTPERVCGSVRRLDEPESHPFKNIGDLEEALRRSVRQCLIPRSLPPSDTDALK